MDNPHYLKAAKASPSTSGKKRGEETAVKLDVSSIPVSRLELGVDLVIGQSVSCDYHFTHSPIGQSVSCDCHVVITQMIQRSLCRPLPRRARRERRGKKGRRGVKGRRAARMSG